MRIVDLPNYEEVDQTMSHATPLDIILREFDQIAQIPRPSHHEEKIGKYLADWARERGLSVTCDELGDVIIDKPAAPGCEHSPRVILQAHMDMVCVAAEGVAFDPLRDPIKVVSDGKVLRAEGTSLGADDGIGMDDLVQFYDRQLKGHPAIYAVVGNKRKIDMEKLAAFGEIIYLKEKDFYR